MFGTTQDRLVKALKVIRTSHCAYSMFGKQASMCDCKYGADLVDLSEGHGMPMGEVANGCPELAEATAILAALTPQQFECAARRGKVLITVP